MSIRRFPALRPVVPDAITRYEFCDKYGITPQTFSNWQQNGRGPDVVCYGRFIFVTNKAEGAWLARRAAGKIANAGRPRKRLRQKPAPRRHGAAR